MLGRRLRWTPVALLAVLLVGTVGYRVIEGFTWLEAVWMVVITLTTIGYGEVHTLSSAGRVFTMLLIVGGLSVVSWSATSAGRYILEGEFGRDLEYRRRRRRMKALNDHFVVVGFGRLGREVAAELVHHGQQVAVVDLDEEHAAKCTVGSFIAGDATQDKVLLEAAVDRARGLAVATGNNAVNVLVTLSARHLNPELTIMTRVDDEETAQKAQHAGADHVCSPHGMGGTWMAQALIRPETRQFVDQALSRAHGDFTIEDVTVGERSKCRGRLSRLRLPQAYGVMVVGIRKGSGALLTLPSGDTELGAGDVVIVVGRPADIARFQKAAR